MMTSTNINKCSYLLHLIDNSETRCRWHINDTHTMLLRQQFPANSAIFTIRVQQKAIEISKLEVTNKSK